MLIKIARANVNILRIKYSYIRYALVRIFLARWINSNDGRGIKKTMVSITMASQQLYT
jgi:hypothetical protein